MRIHKDRAKIETVCEGIYFTEGCSLASNLLNVALVNNKNPNKTNCVGLAANQVGINKRVFVARVGKNKTWRIFINPEITKRTGKVEHDYEGCMTFPGKYKEVHRHTKITLKFQVQARNDSTGDMWEYETFKGFNAKIIQHEMAHLEGMHIFSDSK